MTDTTTTLSITANELIAMEPCNDWSEDRIREIAGDKRWTAMEILALEQVSAKDRLWVVLRPELIAEPVLHELTCRFAEEVLPIWEAEYPADRRLHDAIAAKRAWLRGEITDEQLATARAAAWAAARAGAWVAARAAVRAAVWAAARAAAWAATSAATSAAVWAAAWSAARAAIWEAASGAAWSAAWEAASAAAWKRPIEIVRDALESGVSDE